MEYVVFSPRKVVAKRAHVHLETGETGRKGTLFMKDESIGKLTISALKSEENWKDQERLGAHLPENNVDEAVPYDAGLQETRAETMLQQDIGLPGTKAETMLNCDTGLPGIEVEKRFRAAAKTMARSEAAAAFYLAEIDDRRLWLELGYSSVIAYVAEVSGIAGKKAYALLNIGRRLRELPVIRAAFDEERIGWTKVRDILRIKEPFSETEVLETALTSSSRELEQFVAKKNESVNRLKRKAVAGGDRNQVEIFENEETIIPELMGKTGVAYPVSRTARLTDTGSKKAESGRQNHTAPTGTAAIPASRHVNVTLKLTPEEFAVINESRRVWKRKNPGEWKREQMIISLSRDYLEREARASFDGDASKDTDASFCGDASEKTAFSGDDAKRTGERCTSENITSESLPAVEKKNNGVAPVIIDSPYNIYIHHCPECEKSFMTGKSGDHIEVDESMFGKALCDSAVHIVDDMGVPGRKKRSVSPALRKKIFMRDKGVCRVPGCGKTSSLEVHHVKPLSSGGGNDPSNLLLCCSLCRYRHKLHYADFRVMPTWNTSSILISCMA